jgi:succinate dehydrogenase/fumarate reductase flavoprotein subunit
VIKRKISLIERVMINAPLTSGGQTHTKGGVVGAIGFQVRSGKFEIFKGKSVVVVN